jgi:hypothetical protein
VAAGAKQEGGALEVDLVGGDAAGEFGDGELDGGAVLERRHDEGGVGVDEGFGGGDARGQGMAGGVVDVAEVLLAEGEGAAAVALGEDVAALIAAGAGVRGFGLGRGLGLCRVHFFPPEKLS